MEKLKQNGRSAFKRANNDHRGKLLSLLVEAKKAIPKELERSANGSLSAYSDIDLSNNSTLDESTVEENNTTACEVFPEHRSAGTCRFTDVQFYPSKTRSNTTGSRGGG